MSKKKLPKAIFIACEGRSTEKNYFQLIGETFGEDLGYALTVYPDEDTPKPKSDPIGLVKEAINRKSEGFDELWAVFDKDGYTKHEDAFKLARANDIKIAFSSIAFEEWVLLHFERTINAFQKSDCKNAKDKYINCGSHTEPGDCNGAKCVAGYMRKKGYFPAYTKSSNQNIYPALKAKTENAIINSAWLRFQIGEELKKSGDKYFQLNPYTDVDILVKRLIGIDENHYYYNIGDIIETDEFIAQICVPIPKICISIITKRTGISEIINEANLQDWFSVNCKDRNYYIRLDTTHRIEPNKKEVINLFLSEDFDENAEIIFKWKSKDFYHITKQ
jgi:hypothetical protein